MTFAAALPTQVRLGIAHAVQTLLAPVAPALNWAARTTETVDVWMVTSNREKLPRYAYVGEPEPLIDLAIGRMLADGQQVTKAQVTLTTAQAAAIPRDRWLVWD